MPFCPNCGSAAETAFCPKCGANVAGGATGGGSAPPVAGGLQENVAAALCYIAGLITGIIFLVLAPYNQNPTIRFHAFQSIFCNVAWIVLAIVLGIVTAALPLLLSPLALLFHLVMWLGGLAIWLLLMWKAYNGERFVLPVIGGLAQQQAGK